jgi:O-antigen ligase
MAQSDSRVPYAELPSRRRFLALQSCRAPVFLSATRILSSHVCVARLVSEAGAKGLRVNPDRSMRNVTRYLLWLYVFAVTWDNVAVPLVGSFSRALGLAVACAAFLTMVVEARFRKPDAVLAFAILFGVWSALSLLWTISYENTVISVSRYIQLVLSLWVIREFTRTREEVHTLLIAFFLGLFVPLSDLLRNFRAGIERGGRFTGANLNADGLGMILAIGLPIAWHLFMHRRDVIRVLSLAYLVIAPFGLLLTGTRGAFVAGLAALSIIPITLPRLSRKSYALAGAVMVLCAVALTQVPQATWDRISTTRSEILGGGSMTGRAAIWRAGLQAFPDHEVLGAGAGTYGEAVQPYYHNTRGLYSHNMYIGMLVEGGIVGVAIFAVFLGACALAISRLRPPDRVLWGVVLLTWLVGNMSGALDTQKLSWVLFGLIAAQSGQARTADDVAPVTQRSVFSADPFSPPAAISRNARTASGQYSAR